MEPGLEPHPDVYCDSPTCTRTDTETVIRLACFHCFHQACLPSNRCCPLCLGPLKKKAEKLANTFNNGLVTSKDPDGTEETDDGHQEDEYSSAPSTNMNVSDAEMFYTSKEWSQKVQNTLNTYATIPMPSRANHSISNQPNSAQNTSLNPNSSPRVLTPILIPPNNHGNVTFWSFPSCISQSTILGRTGSNACTFIALLFSKMFFSPNVDIPLINSPLSQTECTQYASQRASEACEAEVRGMRGINKTCEA